MRSTDTPAHAQIDLRGLGWIIANAAGYATGFALWQSTYRTLRPMLSVVPGGILLLAGFGAMVGLCAGLAQAIILRQGLARAGVWIAAAMLGGAVGFAVAARVSEALNSILEPRSGIPLTDAVLVLVFGAIIGASLGGSRWLAFRSHDVSAPRWMLASTSGMMIGYPLAIGVLQLLPPMDQPLVGAAFGLCAGVTTALIEWLIARRQIG